MNAPTVKPFVWQLDSGRNSWPQRWRAVTPICEYSVAGSEGKDNWQWFRNGYYQGPDSRIERSKEAAMAAAFAHHCTLLASCFEGVDA